MCQFTSIIWWLAPISALTALGFALVLYKYLITLSEGTDRMKEIAGYIKDGAMAYLRRQYTTITVVFMIIFITLGVMSLMGLQNPFVPFVFLSGGVLSGLSGYLGMKTATNTSARTAAACQKSLNSGLKVAFRGGAIMGLMVVGFGLLGICCWYFILNFIFDNNIFGTAESLFIKLGITAWEPGLVKDQMFQKVKQIEITSILLTYAMGASAMALFARVGGGIFTKAADVGADLVGKVEAGIPEDDPRNPATIADNVGDNVGDVAGMGADLYESYCGSILAAAALGASLALTKGGIELITAPMIVAGGGIIFSLAGIFYVRTKEDATQKDLLLSLLMGTGLASILTLIFLVALVKIGLISWGVFGSVVTGLIAGIIIGQATEYYTSSNFNPTKKIAEFSQDGQASTILTGISTGMISTGIPVIVIVAGIIISYTLSGGLTDVSFGIYGIAFAAIGMLSTLGIQLATDAFGPIADNAGGNAEMAGLPEEVRERTDALDSLGNTTAATGKGFAIGSAALTVLALITAYLDSIKISLSKLAGKSTHYIGNMGFTNSELLASKNEAVHFISDLDIPALVDIFRINIINPKFLAGLFLGSMLAFVFCALTITAVSNAASEMVKEVRRQFREIKGILTGEATPDYARCVDISTSGAQKAMLLPSLLAILSPIATGYFLNVAGVIGLLSGALVSGFSLAIFLNNSGGAWDNAKKYIESGQFGGKGTDAHKAAVIGDTIGDPFKDTAGPSLNILIKLMTIVSIVFAGFILKYGLFF
ncbi:MAG: sodium-translocating pyrophosphatase [bacterium]|nr:sodium-translocating pyrophosphatase [bacterium]